MDTVQMPNREYEGLKDDFYNGRNHEIRFSKDTGYPLHHSRTTERL